MYINKTVQKLWLSKLKIEHDTRLSPSNTGHINNKLGDIHTAQYVFSVPKHQVSALSCEHCTEAKAHDHLPPRYNTTKISETVLALQHSTHQFHFYTTFLNICFTPINI